MKTSKYLSSIALRIRANEIRELLKLTRKPGMISFAGGLPAPDLFPVDEIRKISDEVLRESGPIALQYGPTEGDLNLREQLLLLLEKEHIKIPMEHLLVLTSSQQGLDLVGKVLIDPGDVVLTSRPTYTGAIQAFQAYGADLRAVELDHRGTRIDQLETAAINAVNEGKKPKFIYEVPDFQNPSGVTMDRQRREQLIDLADRYDLLIVEDSPYRQLRFEGEPQKALVAMNPERVIALYSFSKIMLPGFRVGWMVAPEPILSKVKLAKQSVDLCAPPFNQALLCRMMEEGLLTKQIQRIISSYRDKRDLMLSMLAGQMPKIDGLKWTEPQGGLFLWITLPEPLDSGEMFHRALEKRVAYVVGSAFDPSGKDKRSLRLNFSFPAKDEIREGIKRLAEVIRAEAVD